MKMTRINFDTPSVHFGHGGKSKNSTQPVAFLATQNKSELIRLTNLRFLRKKPHVCIEGKPNTMQTKPCYNCHVDPYVLIPGAFLWGWGAGGAPPAGSLLVGKRGGGHHRGARSAFSFTGKLV